MSTPSNHETPEPPEGWTNVVPEYLVRTEPATDRTGLATLVLAAGLAITLVLLAATILVGVVRGERDLSELGTRALSVVVAATAGALGYQVGSRRNSPADGR
jgi:hypothetical protein